MENGKVSVIVPSYNYAAFISKALSSVKAQTYRNWECIIVDDGSTDNTRDICNEFCINDPRFKYIYQVNGGISAARNTGVSYADGEFICFLDADDFLARRKFEIHASLLNCRSDVDVVYSGVRYFLSQEPDMLYFDIFMTNRRWMPEISGAGVDIFPILVDRNIMAVDSAFFRRSLFKSVGLANIQMRALEDWDFWVRCALKGAYFYFEKNEDALAFVRIHDSSVSTNITNMKRTQLLFRKNIHDKIIHSSEGLPADIRDDAININIFRMAELNIRYLNFLKGWFSLFRLAISGYRTSFILFSGMKSTIKRIINKV
ncbi:MAG TPA: glycosyltransferase [Candidatus Babeliaceae bacterium]|nr:glycosyltransferase [Candidatus Babeliaceae bacterium]